MNASEVLATLRRVHWRAAFVPEVTISDEWAAFDWEPTDLAAPLPVHTRRIDALMFESCVRTAIEIKVSTADARRESPNKVHPWRRVVHRFVYVVPAGLVEVPPVYGCGLWWVHPNGRIEIRRKTPFNKTPDPLPQRVVQILAYRAAGVPLIAESYPNPHEEKIG